VRASYRSAVPSRAQAAGVLAAGANIPLTFQRTLMPRSAGDQAVVTGLSISTNEMLVTFAYDALHSWASRSFTGSRAAAPSPVSLDLAAVGVGAIAQVALRQHDGEQLARAGARTAAFWISVGGAAGTIVDAFDAAFALSRRGRRRAVPAMLATAGGLAALGEWGRRRRARLDEGNLEPEPTTDVFRSLAFGLGVSAATTTLGTIERQLAERLARVAAAALPGDANAWRPVAHALTIAGIGAAGRAASRRVLGRIEGRQGSVETAFDIAPPTPLVSGAYESHVHFSTLSLQGRRFVWMTTPEDVVEKVTGEGATQPIRVYVGLESAVTESERVALALREMERTGAFERGWLMIVAPTGTGYVNYAAVSALEFLARGDCATVAMQYAARPSVLSLNRVAEGCLQTGLLVKAIHERLRDVPNDRRPKVVMFGESLGAWSSQDAFIGAGTQGLAEGGVDYAIWIGTPHFSKWKNEVLAHETDGLAVFHEIDEFRALAAHERERVRYVMVTHHDDGVALFGPELAIQAPAWLGPPQTRPSRVPRGMRWVPTTTFFQVLTDMKNSANVVPGVFDAKGHDYRADLLPFFDAVLGFDESPELLGTIGTWLEERERMRSDWIAAHGDTGRSLAVAVLERLIERERMSGRDPDSTLLRVIREVATAAQPSG
jgi:uncharacterized membrane protein